MSQSGPCVLSLCLVLQLDMPGDLCVDLQIPYRAALETCPSDLLRDVRKKASASCFLLAEPEWVIADLTMNSDLGSFATNPELTVSFA